MELPTPDAGHPAAGGFKVVELRFFGGLSIEEAADALCLSPATVKRHWPIARAWLRRALEGPST